MKLILPLPLNLGNARLHWAEKNRKMNAYFDLCLATVKVKRPEWPLPRADISATLYVWNLMDEGDNMRTRLKWPLDFLVQRGYIEDDSPRTLTWGPVSQAIDRKRPRVEIELVEIIEDEAA